MPCRHRVTAHVLAGSHQVPGGLLLHAGNRHLYDLTHMQQLGKMAGIAPIGFDPVPRRALQLRGRRHLAHPPGGEQEPRESKSGRPGLKGHRHQTRDLA
jgi:hypothetical protein